MSKTIDEIEGRALFGNDPHNYNEIRPAYPRQLYEFLQTTGALRANAATLEIGAGNGLATRRLLELGANPLTIIEPDPRFAPLLDSIARAHSGAEIRIIQTAFEDAELPRDHYDLVAAATSFHWIQPAVGLTKVAAVLKPGGYAALWWHVFGDDERADPFHEATRTILAPLAISPSGKPGDVPFALDIPARLRDFANTAQFETPRHTAFRWTLTLNTQQVGALYGTFSHINRLPEARRTAVLHQLMEVAEKHFAGTVQRNMITTAYVSRREWTAAS
jgi:SAM-dependent methyltransferase